MSLAIGRASNQKELSATTVTHLGLLFRKEGETARAGSQSAPR